MHGIIDRLRYPFQQNSIIKKVNLPNVPNTVRLWKRLICSLICIMHFQCKEQRPSMIKHCCMEDLGRDEMLTFNHLINSGVTRSEYLLNQTYCICLQKMIFNLILIRCFQETMEVRVFP